MPPPSPLQAPRGELDASGSAQMPCSSVCWMGQGSRTSCRLSAHCLQQLLLAQHFEPQNYGPRGEQPRWERAHGAGGKGLRVLEDLQVRCARIQLSHETGAQSTPRQKRPHIIAPSGPERAAKEPGKGRSPLEAQRSWSLERASCISPSKVISNTSQAQKRHENVSS